MNDCIWRMIGVCKENKCKCYQYLSINSERGIQLSNDYGEIVEDILKEFKEQFAIDNGFRKGI